jgi:nickel-dependent lactate racemase
MNRQAVTLPWGKQETITVDLPPAWRLDGVVEPAHVPPQPDVGAEMRRALDAPHDSPRLSALARPGARVTVVIDDLTRPTPVEQLLPGVIAELEMAGVRRTDITLVTALGVHRPMADHEVHARAGAALLATGLHWENHDCLDPARLVDLGVTARGTRVLLNKTVAGADLVVSVGCIEPHLIASFGGGYKNLIPGVAGKETIAHNHALNCRPDTFNMVGQPIERNPMRLDLEEAGRLLPPPMFLVNAVLDASQSVVRIVCGDGVAAHRAGVAVSAQIYGVRVAAQADVVIADSHPMDEDLRQGAKALANTIRAARRGGVQIILMRAQEGLGVMGLADRKLPLGREGLRTLAPLLVRLVPRLKLNVPDDERFFLYFALQAMRHCRTVVYAPSVPADKRAGLPFVEFVDAPAAALARAAQLAGDRASVLAFPYGGVTYPVVG